MSKKKIGAGHFAAMGRLGLKELRNASNPSRESVADNEIGLYGTQTQGEIAAARGNSHEQESTGKISLDDLRKESEKRDRDNERGQENDGLDM